VCYEGVGIPICFEFLDKKGNSNQAERIDLLSQFVEWFGLKRIGLLLADREFIGEDWLAYLEGQGVAYCIRVRNNTLVQMGDVVYSANDLLELYAQKTFEQVEVMKQKVNLSLKRLKVEAGEKPDHLVLITNVAVRQALSKYRKRWTIEVFFQSLKKRGFDLEVSHLDQAYRMKKLFALCCIAFVICLQVGIHQHRNVKAIPTYSHGYKQNSFFRVGKDCLERAIRRFHQDENHLRQLFRPIYALINKVDHAFRLQESFVT
jgi:hypothetical protein